MDIKSAKEYGHARRPKILIYGGPGVGKTILAAQAPRPCLLLDFDRGAGYVGNTISTKGLYVAGAVGMEELWSLACKLGETTEGFKYKSLVLDSLTELQTLHRATLLEERLAPTREDYRINTEFLRRVIRMLQAADVTVIYTCLQDETEDLDGLHIGPALTPALLRNVEAVVEVITYLAIRTVEEEGATTTERVAITAPVGRIKAKDRTGLLPAKVNDPDWDSLYGSLYETEQKEV